MADQQQQPMLMMDPSRLQTGNYDPNNPVVYYLISSGNGQNMMMFMPNDQMQPGQPGGAAVAGDGSQAAHAMSGMLPPNVMIAPNPDQTAQPMSISYIPAAQMAQAVVMTSADSGMKHEPGTQAYATRARRTDVPNCTACGAVGKQVGRSGSRIKDECCLCANCEDRAKRYKKDGLRKAVQCTQTNELFHPGMMPVCPIKHLRKHCPQQSCDMCRTSDNDSCCRACQLAKIMNCIDFERFYARKYKKKPLDNHSQLLQTMTQSMTQTMTAPMLQMPMQPNLTMTTVPTTPPPQLLIQPQ